MKHLIRTMFCYKNKLRLEMYNENNKLEKIYEINKKSNTSYSMGSKKK